MNYAKQRTEYPGNICVDIEYSDWMRDVDKSLDCTSVNENEVKEVASDSDQSGG